MMKSVFWLTLLIAATGAFLPVQAQTTLEPSDNLVAEGIPPIPKALADDVRRYTEARSAGFLEWHPQRHEMLISTRFGNSAQLHLVKMPGGDRKQLTFFSEPVGGATWEPREGRYIVFSKDIGGNEFGQLFRLDVDTGVVTLLTDGGRSQNGGIIWNEAKDKFAFSTTRRNGADRDVWLMDPLDPASAKPLVELTGGGWGAVKWSPDDSKLLLIEGISVTRSNLWLLDVATGEKTPLNDLDQEIAWGRGEFGKDGKGLYLTTDKDCEFQRLAYLDLATKELEYLTPDTQWDVEGFELSPDGRTLAYVTNEAGLSRVWLMDTATRTAKPVEGLPLGVIGGGEWHEDGSTIAFSVNSARSPSDVWSVELASGKATRWTESELGGLVAGQLSEPQLVKWPSFDGKEISGFLYAPPAKFTGRRPVIIDIHGGPEGQSQPVFLGRDNYWINEHGIAMLLPNVRGSTGYGKSFCKLDNGFLRLDSVKDIGALLDWIGKQPGLDPDRVMVWGGSYGGYMTLACATEYNDRLRCALDVVGISHFGTFLKNTESYRRDLRRVEYGDERDPAMAAFFEQMAPLNNAGKISKPLFVVQGGNDPRVPLSEAEQMVSRVRQNGSPVWYLMAKDEGHGFRKKSNADFEFYATVLFVREHLLGQPMATEQ